MPVARSSRPKYPTPPVNAKQKDEPVDMLGDLERGLRFDKHALDDALEQQPELFYQTAKMLAHLTSMRDSLKQALAETESEIDAAIRRKAADDEEKVTEKEIESRKRLSPKVQEATDALFAVQKQIGVWGALTQAYTDRSRAIKGMVDLYKVQYFDNGVSRDDRADSAKREMGRHRNSRDD